MEKNPVSFYIKFCWCSEYYLVFRCLSHSRLHSSSLLRMTDVVKPRGSGSRMASSYLWSIVVRMVLWDCSALLPLYSLSFREVGWRVGSALLGTTFFECTLKMATNLMLERNAQFPKRCICKHNSWFSHDVIKN